MGQFTSETKASFARIPLPSSCSAGEKEWRRVIQKASARSIPAGFYWQHVQGLDREASSLVNERNELRRLNPNDPSIQELNQRIAATIAKTSREKWMTAVKEADKGSNPHRFWSLLKSLSGKRSRLAPNQPVKFKGKTFTKRSSIANQFCSMYANIKPHKSSPASRLIRRKIKTENQLDRNYSTFSAQQTAEVIKASKNLTSVGPNNISILLLKHLGRLGLQF